MRQRQLSGRNDFVTGSPSGTFTNNTVAPTGVVFSYYAASPGTCSTPISESGVGTNGGATVVELSLTKSSFRSDFRCKSNRGWHHRELLQLEYPQRGRQWRNLIAVALIGRGRFRAVCRSGRSQHTVEEDARGHLRVGIRHVEARWSRSFESG